MPIKTITVALDRERHLRLDFNALAQFEEVTGRNTLEQSGWEGFGAREIRALVWAAALHESPELTLESVGEMLTLDEIQKVNDFIEKLLMMAFPIEPNSAGTEEAGDERPLSRPSSDAGPPPASTSD